MMRLRGSSGVLEGPQALALASQRRRASALKQGDVATAKDHLMRTANVPSEVNPGAWPFWPPDPEMVSGLLKCGERETVFEYLDRLKSDPELEFVVDFWKQTMLAGEIPNFYKDCLLAHGDPKERAELEGRYRRRKA